MLVVANVGSFLYLSALAVLVRREVGDDTVARRAAWLAALSPVVVALGLGDAEGHEGLAAVFLLLFLRSDLPRSAAAVGIAAGLARPVGVVLCGAALVDLLLRRPGTWRAWRDRLAAVVSPAAGTGLYLSYALHDFGDASLPFSVTSSLSLHGPGLSKPFTHLTRIPPAAGRFDVVLVLLAVALCVACARLLPLPYSVWSAATIVAGTTSWTESSLPRYLCSAFPLLTTAACSRGIGRDGGRAYSPSARRRTPSWPWPASRRRTRSERAPIIAMGVGSSCLTSRACTLAA